MNVQVTARHRLFQSVVALAFVSILSVSFTAMSAGLFVYDTTIVSVTVNGGSDAANPGTTCIRISSAVSSVCPIGFVAIPNNNKQLIAAALMSKTTASRTSLYYDDAGSYHCPGQVFTPCSVISIEIN